MKKIQKKLMFPELCACVTLFLSQTVLYSNSDPLTSKLKLYYDSIIKY